MRLKICGRTGCNRLVYDGISYCKEHEAEYRDNRRKQYQEYDKKRKSQEKHRDIYNTSTWKTVSKLGLRQTMYIDVMEYYKHGAIVVADKCHHIVPLEEDVSLAYSLDNLIGLSESTHRLVHSRYDKSKEDYEQVSHMLRCLRDKFMADFGIGV